MSTGIRANNNVIEDLGDKKVLKFTDCELHYSNVITAATPRCHVPTGMSESFFVFDEEDAC